MAVKQEGLYGPGTEAKGMDGWRKEDGQGTVEYAFILMVVAFVLLAGFGLLGDTVSAFFQATGNLLQSLLP